MAKDFPIFAKFGFKDLISGPLKKVTNNLKPLARQLKAVKKNASGVASGIKGILSPFASFAALGSAISIAGIGVAVKQCKEYADTVGNLSERLGVSTKFIQQQHFAAQLNASSAEEMNRNLEYMVKNYGQLKAGSGAMLSALQKISPALLAQLKGAKSNEEAFKIMLRSIRAVQDPAKKVFLATTYFGKSGSSIINMANQSEEALSALAEQAEKTGNVMSDQAVHDAMELNDSVDRLKFSVSGVVKTLTAYLLPVIIPLVKRLTGWIEANRELINTNLQNFFKEFANIVRNIDFEKILSGTLEFIHLIREMIDRIGGFKQAAVIVAVALNSGLIVSIVSLTLSLSKLIGMVGIAVFKLIPFPQICTGTIRAVKGIISVMSLLSSVIKGVILSIVQFGMALLANPITWYVGAVMLLAGAAYLIYKNWKPIKKFFVDLWDGIVAKTREFAGKFMEFIQPVLKTISKLMNSKIATWALKKVGLKSDDEKHPQDTSKLPRERISDSMKNQASSSSEAKVVVKFDNMPRDANVSTTSIKGDVDLGVESGYAMPTGVR